MLWLLFALGLQAAEVRGVVVDEQGRPIGFAGTTFDPRLSCCFTDKSGAYSFTTDAPFYVFRKAGFQSSVVRTRHRTKEHVIMKQLAGSEAALPSCGKKAGQTIGLYGSVFRFRDASGVKTSGVARDIDYTLRVYTSGSHAMRHGYGPMWSFGVPSINSLNQRYKEKVWEIRGRQIVDARGETYEGKRWRFLGTFGETVEYSDIDPDTARVFDKFLDSVCVSAAR